jgi:hypothetical protein
LPIAQSCIKNLDLSVVFHFSQSPNKKKALLKQSLFKLIYETLFQPI